MNGLLASGTKLIFLHVPKTAGSTFRHIIERQYDSSSILHLYESDFGEELAAIPPTQTDGAFLFWSAYLFVSSIDLYQLSARSD